MAQTAEFTHDILIIGSGAAGLTAAITLANEGTLRDWVRHAKFNVTQGKNWDASGAIGPWLVPYADPSQIVDVALETRVNTEQGGPIVAVQPDGVWYYNVTDENMDRIVEEHLKNGRVVEDLVFHRNGSGE